VAAFYPAFGPWMRRVLAAAPRCGRTRVDCPIPLPGCARAVIGPVRMRGPGVVFILESIYRTEARRGVFLERGMSFWDGWWRRMGGMGIPRIATD